MMHTSVRRRCSGVLVALFMSVGLLAAVVSTAGPAQAANCYVTNTADTERIEMSNRRDMWVKAKVHFRQCVSNNGKRRWAEPISYTVSYNREGGGMSCGTFGWVRGVYFNGYFWDNAGAVHNPGRVYLGCSTDGKAEQSYDMRMAPNFYYCNGVPHWLVNAEVNVRPMASNPSTNLRNSMWSFVGPVPNNC